MGYFSRKAAELHDRGWPDRSYPSRRETLQYYLEDLTQALEILNDSRPQDRLHQLYDRNFYSNGRYRYYEVLWAERPTV